MATFAGLVLEKVDAGIQDQDVQPTNFRVNLAGEQDT
jgi:hypothetical protein